MEGAAGEAVVWSQSLANLQEDLRLGWTRKVVLGGAKGLCDFFFFLTSIFNWRIVIPCCAGFCHTTTWISSKYTYIPSFLRLPPPPPQLQVITEHQAELPVLNGSFPLTTYFTHSSLYTSILLTQFVPLIFPLCLSVPCWSVTGCGNCPKWVLAQPKHFPKRADSFWLDTS